MSAIRQLLVVTAIGCAWFTTAQAVPTTATVKSPLSFEAQGARM